MDTFQTLVRDKTSIRTILKRNCIFGEAATYEWWKTHRAFIVHALHRSGSILDIGCANGFLLKSLMQWSSHTLVPYGLDALASCIREARELLPDYQDNFVCHRIQEIETLSTTGLPAKFDIIYWHVWDNWYFRTEREWMILDEVWKLVDQGGRLILGFYDANRVKNQRKIEKLEHKFKKAEGFLASESNFEVIVWFDKLR